MALLLPLLHHQFRKSKNTYYYREEAANKRFLKFLRKNPDIQNALFSEAEPTDDQLKRLMTFMINDKFFQKKVLSDTLSKPENEWMKELS